ncbi:hypothetical protein RN001_008727 [Aquatica leii]|uniref:C2H2-type domain-containing protein n=1 Tax=Aquatica leii TaxID=1421715 RepID=A0AAN7PHL6_9COLE|nr:hypothetical protein RN001_008727 [Aquatica leii]
MEENSTTPPLELNSSATNINISIEELVAATVRAMQLQQPKETRTSELTALLPTFEENDEEEVKRPDDDIGSGKNERANEARCDEHDLCQTDQSCDNKSDLKRDDKTKVCHQCGHVFTRSDNLKRHLQNSCKGVAPAPNDEVKKRKFEDGGESSSKKKIDDNKQEVIVNVRCNECQEDVLKAHYRGHLRSNRHKINACRFIDDEGIQIIQSAFQDRLMSYKLSPSNQHVKVVDLMNEFKVILNWDREYLAVVAMLKLTIIFPLLFLFTVIKNSESNPYVKTEQGELIGKLWKSRKGRTFIGFTGIPYAKPPVGSLRFKAPEELETWNGILNATSYHSACLQLGSYNNEDIAVGSEDCLFLNVYTPKISSNDYARSRFSVLFYIHGGSFVANSARPDWLSPEMLLDKDIVLVTVNYRLGPFGFLSTGDNIIPGNSGLKDQNLALKWVKKNILHFGGNPNQITIVGNSAGAASVQFHLMSPLSKNLVQGAIIQSGSALSPFALSSKEEAIENTYKLGKLLGCSTSTINTLIKCLQKVNFADIIKAQPKFMYWGMDSTIAPFRPVVEPQCSDAFITKHPIDILNSNEVANIPVMIGITGEEGSYQAAGITTSSEFINEFNNNFESIVLREFNISSNNKNFVSSIKKFYFNDQEVTNKSKSELSHLYSDGWWLWQLDYTVQKHLLNRESPIYVYLYDYVGSISFVSLYDNSGYDYGVGHTDELFHLLPRNRSFPNYVPTEADNKVTDVMTTLWSNFVHFGDPTPSSNLNMTTWHPVSTGGVEYYYIKDSTNMNMKTRLLLNRRRFWQSGLGLY